MQEEEYSMYAGFKENFNYNLKMVSSELMDKISKVRQSGLKLLNLIVQINWK